MVKWFAWRPNVELFQCKLKLPLYKLLDWLVLKTCIALMMTILMTIYDT